MVKALLIEEAKKAIARLPAALQEKVRPSVRGFGSSFALLCDDADTARAAHDMWYDLQMPGKTAYA